MKVNELVTLLEGLNIPIAFNKFKEEEGISPPFIQYIDDSPDLIPADDKNYFQYNHFIVDLVTDNKDFTLEESLEQIFNNNNLIYEKEPSYIDTEKVYLARYFI